MQEGVRGGGERHSVGARGNIRPLYSFYHCSFALRAALPARSCISKWFWANEKGRASAGRKAPARMQPPWSTGLAGTHGRVLPTLVYANVFPWVLTLLKQL